MACSQTISPTCGGHPQTLYPDQRLQCYFPHLWGSSATRGSSDRLNCLFPPLVGVIRPRLPCRDDLGAISPTCGGHPHPAYRDKLDPNYFPHLWGSSGKGGNYRAPQRLFPPLVGVIRHRLFRPVRRETISPTCGGHPPAAHIIPVGDNYFPYLWGSSAPCPAGTTPAALFPPLVGVIRSRPHTPYIIRPISPTCGGHPSIQTDPDDTLNYCPHLWGSSAYVYRHVYQLLLFPPLVGVIRSRT